MKDLSRNVSLLCPVCGNDQFSTVNMILKTSRMHQMKQELNARIVEPHARKQN
jgi:hypothetical protein